LDLFLDRKDSVSLIGIEGEEDSFLGISDLDVDTSLDLDSFSLLDAIILDGFGVVKLLVIKE
jgi:hypothetical protein